MKGNERPKGYNFENEGGRGAAKVLMWDKGKTDRFWQLVGRAPRAKPRRCQGYPTWSFKRPNGRQKGHEMKAQKAKMKGNECPKGQNERK